MRVLFVVLWLASATAWGDGSSVRCGTDPWEPFITEAAQRFEIPAVWIRAILRSESAGCEHLKGVPTTSDAGAMGLMQLLPATWNTYRQRLKLGDNAYDAHANIVAGAAYLRDLYDRYGWPGAVAAYHAGPGRYEAARDPAKPLPAATLDYLARVERAMTYKPAATPAKPSSDPPKPNPLFVELRHQNGHLEPSKSESSDVQN